MSFLQRFDDDIENLKRFSNEVLSEVKQAVSNFDQRHDPKTWIQRHPALSATVAAVVIGVLWFPLMAIWILACAGTAYPSYKIITSYLADKEKAAHQKKIDKEVSTFVQQCIAENRIVDVPIKQHSTITQRRVIIYAQLEDGVSVKDPETGIHMKYPWDSIDIASFHGKYILAGE